jgi:uncharacterized protein (TIGR03086 family)
VRVIWKDHATERGGNVSSTLDRYDVAAAGFRRRLAPLGPHDDARPTPCEGWDVATLVEHTLGALALVTNLVSPTVEDERSATHLDRYDVLVADLREKTADPALGATVVDSPFGKLALKQLVSSIIVHDLLVHTWDLARSTGGDEHLDDALVEHTAAHMSPLDDVLREHGFGPKVTAPADADAQTQLLCFLGRDV